MCFLAFKFCRKQLLNFKNVSVSHCFRNSSLTIIWSNLSLSNYNRMKRKLGLKKQQQEHTCFNFRKELFSPLFKRESSFSNAFVAPLNHSIVLGRIFCWTFIERCFLKYVFFSKFKIAFHTFLRRQTQIIPNDSQWRILETAWHRSISEIW